MSVRSDNFSKLIAMIVVEDKSGVVSFLRSQGINASESASNSAIIQAIGRGMQSDKFVQAFSQWAKSRYEPQSNFNYKGASGFDPMETQSGGFTTISTQGGSEANFSNVSGQDSWWKRTFGKEGTIGNTIGGLGGVDGILNKYLEIRSQDKASSDARALANAEVEAKRLELETAVKLGEIKKEEYAIQLALLDKQGQGGGGNTVLYIVLGVVLLGAIGTTIYFATRKK